MAEKNFDFKILSENRQAGHNYFLSDRYEAGIVLTGTEVKAARAGKIQLRESYAVIERNEAWLMNAHISEYSHGNFANHTPMRSRKLLLHRKEIDKLLGATREKGLSLIPTKVYLKKGRVKCEFAIAKGKKLYDKRETERARTADDEARSAVRASKAAHLKEK
ncbi:MAG: SsrA-binding protein SmpB [Acidobacteriota bacterium]|nr:SsrA-binding protein SmpB [Acidobacteriota bacterium]